MGRAEPNLCGGEVHHLHDGGVAVDAGGDIVAGIQRGAGGDLLRCSEDNGDREDCSTGTDVAVRGVCAGVRNQGADVSVPHLAARRAY